MKTIRYLVSMAGPDVVITPGMVAQVQTSEAVSLISAGYAELVPEVVQTATTETVEYAVAPRRKGKRNA